LHSPTKSNQLDNPGNSLITSRAYARLKACLARISRVAFLGYLVLSNMFLVTVNFGFNNTGDNLEEADVRKYLDFPKAW